MDGGLREVDYRTKGKQTKDPFLPNLFPEKRDYKMTTRERQLLALCEEMSRELGAMWLESDRNTDRFHAHKEFRLRLDRLTKRKGKR